MLLSFFAPIYMTNTDPIMLGATYRIIYMHKGKEMRSMRKKVESGYPIAKLRYSQLSEVWTKNHEWEFPCGLTIPSKDE